MKKVLIATGVAFLALATIASAQGYTFNANLTVGSTGADVVALQTWLMANGYNIPAIASGAAAKGYFGSQTKTAVMAYQGAKSIPTTGFVGPLTRGALNAGGGAASVGVATCPAGYTCTANTTTPVAVVCPLGYTCTPQAGTTGTVVTSGITTVGVEGTISATQTNAGLSSAIYEGQTKVPVLAAKVEAKNSDMRIERVKLDLSTDSKLWNKIYSKVYIMDGSTILASSDLNSSTVVKDGTIYYITLSGMNWIVSKDQTKVLTIAVDVRPSIDTTDIDTETFTIRFAANGIRAVDGAGIDQYSPAAATTVTRAQNVDPTLTDSATLTISLNNSTPKRTDVVATEGSSEDELTKMTALIFDAKAEKDNVTITDLTVTIAKTGTGGANASTTAYLYDGSTELDSATVSAAGLAAFTDSNGIITIPAGIIKTLTVKLDIASANTVVGNFTTSIAAASDVTAVNSILEGVTESGTASGNRIGVRNVGAEISLVSKSVAADGTPQSNGVTTNVSTSTLTAHFVVRVTAKGAALQFGTLASTTPMFASTTASFQVYMGGVAQTALSSYSTSTSMTNPSGLTVTNNTFTVPEGTTVEIPVDFSIEGRSASAALTRGIYTVGLVGIQTNAPYAATFMSGESDWVTDTGLSFP